jgi:hypothetical protein
MMGGLSSAITPEAGVQIGMMVTKSEMLTELMMHTFAYTTNQPETTVSHMLEA